MGVYGMSRADARPVSGWARVRLRPAGPRPARPGGVPGQLPVRRVLARHRPPRRLRRGQPELRRAGEDPAANPDWNEPHESAYCSSGPPGSSGGMCCRCSRPTLGSARSPAPGGTASTSSAAARTRSPRSSPRQSPDAVVNCTGRLTGTGAELVEANTVVTAKLIEAIAAASAGRAVRPARIGRRVRARPARQLGLRGASGRAGQRLRHQPSRRDPPGAGGQQRGADRRHRPAGVQSDRRRAAPGQPARPAAPTSSPRRARPAPVRSRWARCRRTGTSSTSATSRPRSSPPS